jgi:type I restriction enzyme, R subunit
MWRAKAEELAAKGDVDVHETFARVPSPVPQKVAADAAYQNAKQNSDKQNARIEHDKALGRVIIGLMKDDTELFKQYSDNADFKRWLADTIFGITYERPPAP